NFPPTDDYDRVLNGIAYNAATQHFYITGKKWPALFEVTFN
ncbi:glutaminyl-peptide cyclotransferase, partial [Stenotrophomonas maltophilia]